MLEYSLLLGSVIYLLLGVFVAARASGRGDTLLLILIVTSFFWPALYYVELQAETLPVMVRVTGLRHALILLVPLSQLLLLLHLTEKEKKMPRGAWPALGLATAVLAVCALTTPWHSWFIRDVASVERNGWFILEFAPGPFYHAYALYCYALSFINLGLLAGWLRNGSYWRKRQALLLGLAGLLPMLCDLGHKLGFGPESGFRLAPAILPVSGVLIVWAVHGYRLAKVSPVARAALPDLLPSIVVVLDEMHQIVDLNRCACQALGCVQRDLIRIRPDELEQPWRHWVDPDWSPAEAGRELEAHVGGDVRFFHRRVQPLMHRGRIIGFLIHLDDVTEQLEANLALAKKDRLLEQERLLKDLHDGVGGICAHLGLLAQLAILEQNDANREKAMRGIIGLSMEMGVEIRRFISTLEQPDFGLNDWMLEVRTFCKTALDGLPIRLHLQIESSPSTRPVRADAGLSIYRLIKEAVTNVVKHADATDIWVTVQTRNGHLYIEVKDNGRGIQGDPEKEGGLANIRERVCKMGGRAELLRTGGVAHRIWIPIEGIWRSAGGTAA